MYWHRVPTARETFEDPIRYSERFQTFFMLICEYMDVFTTSHCLTSYGTFLLPLRLESASKNTLFREPFGGLDDHYPSVPKRNKTPHPTRPHANRRARVKWLRGELGLCLFCCCSTVCGQKEQSLMTSSLPYFHHLLITKESDFHIIL